MDRQLRHVVAIDANEAALRVANSNMTSVLHTYEHLDPVEVSLVRGNLCTLPTTEDCNDEVAAHVRRSPASLPRCIDAVVSCDVMEHIPPHEIPHFTEVLFAELGAARGAFLVLLTTTNRSENKRLHQNVMIMTHNRGVLHPEQSENGDEDDDDDDDDLRGYVYADDGAEDGSMHPRRSIYDPITHTPPHRYAGHTFELTPDQFQRYCEYVVEVYGSYWQRYQLLTDVGNNVSHAAVFYASKATTPTSISMPCSTQLAENVLSASVVAEGHVRQPSSSVLCRADSGGRMQRFPFEAVFGMRWDDYVAEFLVDGVAERGRDDDGACDDALHDQHRYGHLSCSVYETHSVVSATLRDLWQLWCSSVYAAVSARRDMGPDYSSMPVCVAELPQLIRSPWEASVRHLHRCLCQQYAAWEEERLSSSRTAAVWLSWHGTGVRHVVQNLYAAAFDPDDVQRTLPSDDEMYETCASLRGYTRGQQMELQHVLFSLTNVTCSLLVLGQLRQRLQRDLQDVTRCYSKCSAVLPEHVHLVVAYLAAVDVLGGTMAWWRECVRGTQLARKLTMKMVPSLQRDEAAADNFLFFLSRALGNRWLMCE